jgi:hypothetical protein
VILGLVSHAEAREKKLPCIIGAIMFFGSLDFFYIALRSPMMIVPGIVPAREKLSMWLAFE